MQVESSLYGCGGDVQQIIKFITIREEGYRRVEVEEQHYRREGLVLVVQQQRNLLTNTTAVRCKQYTTPDRSKNRRVISRLVSYPAECAAEERGVFVHKKRYSCDVYSYRGAEVSIVNNFIFVTCITEGPAEGEKLLGEVREKLRPWVDLVMPPQELWDLLL